MRLFTRGPGVPTVTAAEADARLRSGGLVLVDVREPVEVGAAAVPGAVTIPLGELGARAGELPRTRQVAFICRSGGRSASATRAALNAGFHAVNVEGGMLAWARAGLPLESDDRKDAT